MKNTKRKLLFSIIYIFFVLNALRLFESMVQPAIPNAFVGRLIYQVFFTVLSVIGAVLFRKTSSLKLQATGFGAGMKAGLLITLTYAVMLAAVFYVKMPTFTATKAEMAMFFAQMLLVGVSEEVLFRAVLQNLTLDVTGEDTVAAARKGILFAGTLFGLVHLSNIISGVTVLAAVDQAVMAIPMGVVLGVIYFRSRNNLLVPVLIHALVDTASFIGQDVLSGISTKDAISQLGSGGIHRIGTFALYAAIALFLMRKKPMEKAIEARRAA